VNRLALVLAMATGCAGTVPPVQYYRLALPEELPTGERTEAVLAVDVLEVDAAYDDQRIVYREGEYEMDYYHYHRWSSLPGTAVADYLRRALSQTGRFRAVLGEPSPETTVRLGGRVIALEEVDRTAEQWVGRLVLELWLRDADTGETLWTRSFEEKEPLPERSPTGLAAVVSEMLRRVVEEAAPEIARVANARGRDPEPAGTGTGTDDTQVLGRRSVLR
jgi:uncharacterized lipoprotein YmbA